MKQIKLLGFGLNRSLPHARMPRPTFLKTKTNSEICTIDILKMHKSGLASAQTESFFERQNKMASS